MGHDGIYLTLGFFNGTNLFFFFKNDRYYLRTTQSQVEDMSSGNNQTEKMIKLPAVVFADVRAPTCAVTTKLGGIASSEGNKIVVDRLY